MLEFESTNIHDLQSEFDVKALEISVNIVKSVIKGLIKDVDKVEIGTFNKIDMALWVTRDSYLYTLEANLPNCEKAEQYELCTTALKWIKLLKKQ